MTAAARRRLGALAERIGQAELERRCAALGGLRQDSRADLEVCIPFLPRFPLTLRVWFADEELPASCRVFVDASADHYLSVEDAVTAGELLLRRLERESAFRPLLRQKAGPGPGRVPGAAAAAEAGRAVGPGRRGLPLWCLPLNHWYDEQTGRLYFHCGPVGHKLDAIARQDKVSYCVIDDGTPSEDGWSLYFRCVIVFGRARLVDDPDQIRRVARALSYKFTDDEAFIEREIAKYAAATKLIELRPEHMSGKRVHEA